MAIIKKFIHNNGKVVIRPVIRRTEELFSTTVQAFAKSQGPSVIINSNFYDLSLAGKLDAFDGDDPVPAEETTPLGHVVENGIRVAGKSQPFDFYLAFDQPKSIDGVDLTLVFATGQGDPPLRSAAFGGLGPLIINGLAYGNENKYRAGAPAGSPLFGEPPPASKSFLTQRSSAKYTAFASRDKAMGGSLGKTCVAVAPRNIMIYVQEDGTTGMTIDAIRDEFLSGGCKHGVFFDGSDSSMLFDRSAGFLVRQGPDKNETCVVGLAAFWFTK